MRLRIHHQTIYRYETPARRVVQAMRLWPAPCDGQSVESWQVRIDDKPVQPRCRDGFGNAEATFGREGPVSEIAVSVSGIVLTRDHHGVVSGTHEPLPPEFFLNESDLTRADEAIQSLAASLPSINSVERMHQLMALVRERIDFKADETHAETTAAEALAHGFGVCQDHAQVMCATARVLGCPARYVSGYLWIDCDDVSPASHAWCEVFLPDLGWVGFDAANRVCPGEAYVRIAVGRDARDAVPIRGLREGGQVESLEVNVRVAIAATRQTQQ